jgi:hypothetical protein
MTFAEFVGIKKAMSRKDISLYILGCMASALVGFLLCAVITGYW